MNQDYNLPPGVSSSDEHINPPDVEMAECEFCVGTGKVYDIYGIKHECPDCKGEGEVELQ